MSQLLAALSGILIAVAYFSFFRATVKGEMHPSRASWTVWFVQDLLMAASALKTGIGTSAVMPVVWLIGATVMMILCRTHGKSERYTALDVACLGASGVGIVLWAFTGSAMTALVSSVASACVGAIPTIVKAWRDPKSEDLSGWMLMFTATTCNALALQDWSLREGFLPVSVGVVQAAIVAPLVAEAVRMRLESVRESVTHDPWDYWPE